MYTFNMAVHLQAQQKMDMIPRKLVLGSFSSELYIFVSYTVEPNGGMVVTTLSTNNQRDKREFRGVPLKA